jgi:hypothetical protein
LGEKLTVIVADDSVEVTGQVQIDSVVPSLAAPPGAVVSPAPGPGVAGGVGHRGRGRRHARGAGVVGGDRQHQPVADRGGDAGQVERGAAAVLVAVVTLLMVRATDHLLMNPPRANGVRA